MNPLDARESDEYGPDGYEPTVRPYVLPTMPRQAFRVLSTWGDVPTAQVPGFNAVEDWETDGNPFSEDAWSDKYLTAEDARVLRQDMIRNRLADWLAEQDGV